MRARRAFCCWSPAGRIAWAIAATRARRTASHVGNRATSRSNAAPLLVSVVFCESNAAISSSKTGPD